MKMKENRRKLILEKILILLHLCAFCMMFVEGLLFNGNIINFNKRLENKILRSIYGLALHECYQECERRPLCHSVNYRRMALLCQLNGVDVVSNSGNLAIQQRGFVYLERQAIGNVCGTDLCTQNQACDKKTNSCHYEECQIIQAPERGTIFGNVLSEGGRLLFLCDDNHVIYANNTFQDALISECLHTGAWSHENFQCDIVTCKLRLEKDPSVSSGLFPFEDPVTRKQIDIFCDFQQGFGYTFISKDDFGNISSLSYHYTRLDHVVLRHVRSDKGQRQSEVSILPAYSALYNLSVLLDESTDFSSPRQSVLRPYILVGFVPNSHGKKRGQKHGYVCNNVEISYTNCDANNANYIAVFQGTTAQNHGHVGVSVGYAWVISAEQVHSDRFLPEEFFGLFEVGMGGCGSYITNDFDYDDNTALGAAVGLPFDV